MKINKIIHGVWIGNKPRPKKWMDSWKKKNPEWEYILWDNERVNKTKIINRKQFDYYYKRKEFNGATDLLRYQILEQYGGFTPPADTKCKRPIAELFNNGKLFAISCRGNLKEWKRMDGQEEGIPKFLQDENEYSVTPIIAGEKGNAFLRKMNRAIGRIKEFKRPAQTTGNALIQKMIQRHRPKIIVFPMHYFMPEHPQAWPTNGRYKYIGKDKPYAEHYWGSSLKGYERERLKDLVYITKGCPTIKYSIRSAVKNLKFKRLVIVGPKGEITPDIHIKEKDTSDNKIKNVARKLIKVSKSRITNDFILIDDDIFIMKPYIPKLLNKGLLNKNIRVKRKSGIEMGEFWKAAIETVNLLGLKTGDYSIHAPSVMNKKNIREMEKKYEISSGKYLTRTLYYNLYKDGKSKRTEDFKTSNYNNEREIISTTDKIERSKEFKEFITGKFPNKSKYEK